MRQLWQKIVVNEYNTSCLACGETLLDKRIWNDISGRGGICNKTCQYTILINDWHYDDWKDIHTMNMNSGEWQVKLLEIKNNPLSLSELEYVLIFDVFGNIEDNPEEFHEHYQQLFSDNNEGIMPEYMHNTDTGFDLKYPEKDTIKLEPHLHTCIDLKVALEIPATTMVQLASKSSLAKKRLI
ncbi:hypothetical protein G9A89_007295 [Geosiphon pyriformis]|nr:hypothetical protein G9A89_007295 [Geosiphon pyriformis]